MGKIYDMMNGEQQEVDEETRLQIAKDVDKTPEQASRVLRLQAETGLPADMIESNIDLIEAETRKHGFDAKRFRKESPIVSSWLAENQNHWAATQDDIENMTGLERATKRAQTYGRALPAGVVSLNTGIIGVLEAGATNLFAAPGQFLAEKGLFPANPFAGLAGWLRGQREYGERLQQSIAGEIPAFMGRTERAAVSGVQSAGMNVVALLAGVATRNPNVALGLMSTSAGGLKYGEAINEGHSPSLALTTAMGEGAVEYITEKLPVDMLLDALEVGSPFYKTVLNQLAVEIPQEQAATVLQDFNDWMQLNPEKTVAEFRDERLGAAYDTLIATIVGTSIQTASITGADKLSIMMDESDRSRRALENQTFFAALGDLTEESKFKKRLPKKFEEMVSRIREKGPVENINIPVDKFVEYFQSQGLDPEQVAEEATGSTAAFDEAMATKDDIAIPLEKYVANLAGTEHHRNLIPNMRLHPNEMTMREAESWRENRDKMLADLDEAGDGAYSSEIYETIRDQLIAAGTDPVLADQQAKLVAAGIENMALSEGLDPKEYFSTRWNTVTRQPSVNIDRSFSQVVSMQGPQLERIRRRRQQLDLELEDIATRVEQATATHSRYIAEGVDTSDDEAMKRQFERDLFSGALDRDQTFGFGTPYDEFAIIRGQGRASPQSLLESFRALDEQIDELEARRRELTIEIEQLDRNVDVIFSGVPLSERSFEQRDMEGDDLRAFAGAVLRNDPRAQAQIAARGDQRGPVALRGAPTRLSLEGLGIREFGVHEPARAAARGYMEAAGLPYSAEETYAPLDVARAEKIAREFEAMEHRPEDPDVQAAYQAMIEETLAQYQAILDTGLEIEFISGLDPYAGNPRKAILDVTEKNHLYVFSTREGFGSDETFDASQNPLLQETEFEISGQKALANDIFRVVHDYFGHIKNGVGFRARGEENAWQSHASMYSPLARRAMTVETRGQNSWVNFGPHGETNRTASAADTIYADQKIGLLPLWVSEEGRSSDTRPKTRTAQEGDGSVDRPLTAPPVRADGRIELTHFSKKEGLTRIDPAFEGTGADAAPAARRRAGQRGEGALQRSYFGIAPGVPGGYRRETLVGGNRHTVSVAPEQLYDLEEDPMGLWTGDIDSTEIALRENGYTGWWRNHPALGLVAVALEPLQVEDTGKEFNQSYARNSIGLYSGVEKAVWDMKLPEWKAADGRATGKSIWAKLKKMPGVKQEELHWLGLEEYMTNNDRTIEGKPEKYTRAQVAEFIRNNGVQIEEVVGSEVPSDVDPSGIQWEESIDDDSSNWEHRVEDYLYEFERTDFVGELSTDVGWFWDHNEWIENNFDKILDELGIRDNRIPGQEDFLVGGEGDLGNTSDFETILLLAIDYEDQFGFDVQTTVRELMRDDFEQAAREAAESEYMDDPITIYYSEELEVLITGNDDHGYTIDGQFRDIYSFNEAEIQAIEVARENGVFIEEDEDSPYQARWAQYVEGSYENYRELKLTLPDNPGEEFHETGHFPDANIVAFLRVTDRGAPTSVGTAVGKALGERVKAYHIDEFQSDWHQQGRQFGYALPDEQQDQLRAERREIIRKYAERPGMTSEETRRITQQMSSPLVTSMPEHPAYFAQKYIEENVPAETVERLREIERVLGDNVVPDAPFKGDNWLNLGLKRAIVDAVENGYDAVSWVDSNTLMNSRWSPMYETLFKTQYDTKMPSIVKKLTGQVPAHFDWDGQPWARSKKNDLYDRSLKLFDEVEKIYSQYDDFSDIPSGLTTREDIIEDIHDEVAVLARNFWSHTGQAGDQVQMEVRRRVLQNLPASERDRVRELVSEADRLASAAGLLTHDKDPAGYWIIPISDELREQVKTEGFSLWQRGESPNGRITFDATNKATVELLRSANPSTFLHEAGHFWLEMLGDLSEQPGASQRTTEMYATTLKWLGVENRQGITTDHHERFARGFEAYLLEGKAPTPELQTAFSAFRAWLLNIYKTIRGLNVTINDDIRSVFDRLLASDDQIEAARTMQNYVQLFATAEDAGMTEQMFRAYKDTMRKARAEAEEKTIQKLLDVQVRQSRRWWKDERKRVREDVAERVQGVRGYRALSILTLGKDPDGTESELAGLKLDKQDLIDRRGKDFLKSLPRPYVYTLEGGTDADLVAIEFGYASANELLDDLVRLKSQPMKDTIEIETDRVMAQRYPDPMLDGSLATIAMDAVHNDMQANMLAAELRALRKKKREVQPFLSAKDREERDARNEARKKMPGRDELAIIKAAAREFISRKIVREVNPNTYLIAESKAGRKAFQAMERKDYEAAYDAKLTEIQNHELYRAAVAAKEDSERIRKYLKKFDRKAVRQRIGKAGQGYLENIDLVLDQIDLRKISGAEIDRQEARNELRQAFSDGLIMADESVMTKLGSDRGANWKQLSVAELSGVRDVVKQLETLARREATAIIDGERILIKSAADEITASLYEHNEKKPERYGEKTWWEENQVSGGELLGNWLNSSEIARILDAEDFGAITRNVITVMRKAVTDKFVPMEEKYLADVRKIYLKHYSYKELKELRRREEIEHSGGSMELSRSDMISLALNWGNESSREALLNGVSDRNDEVAYPQDLIDTVLSKLTAKDYAFVEDIWAYLDSYWPELEKAERRRRGVAPKKIESLPFTVTTADGETITVSGGYYPLNYNRLHSERQSVQDLETHWKKMGVSGYVAATTRAGSTHERVQNHGKVVELGLGAIDRHLREIIRDIAVGDEVSYLRKVLNDKDLRKAFRQVGQEALYSELNRWLVDSAVGELAADGALQRFLAYTRVGFTISVLSWKVTTTLLQLTGVAQSMAVVGSVHYAKGLGKYMSNPVGAHRFIMERSGFMRARYQNKAFNKDVQDTFSMIQSSGAPSLKGDLKKLAASTYFYPIMMMQKQVDITTWLGAFAKGTNEKMLSPADAATYADVVVEQSQTSGLFSDRSGIERGTVGFRQNKQNQFIRIWTTLISYMLRKGNIAYQKGRHFAKHDRSIGGFVFLMTDYMLLFTVEAMLSALIYGRWPDDDDDESVPIWVAKETLLSATSGIPVVRDIQGAKYGSGQTPLGALSVNSYRLIEQMGQLGDEGEWMSNVDRQLIKNANKVGGQLLHYPSGQIGVAVDAYMRQQEGEDVEFHEYLLGKRDHD